MVDQQQSGQVTLTAQIRQQIAASPFHGEGHRKIWARLRHQGVRTSKDRVLRLRHDHGSQYLSHDFQQEVRFLGIEPSPAFVRQPEGNGCIERFFRTLKEQLLWVRHFANLEQLRHALLEFRDTYNRCWLIERLGFRSPLQARQDFLAVETAA